MVFISSSFGGGKVHYLLGNFTGRFLPWLTLDILIFIPVVLFDGCLLAEEPFRQRRNVYKVKT